MRYKFILLLIVITIMPLLFATETQTQIINDNRIPPNLRPLWHQAGLLPTSRAFAPETPTEADQLVVIDRNSALSVDQQIQNAIDNASGTTIIYFPGGRYYIQEPIELVNNGSSNNSNIIFQGAGPEVTFLVFAVGSDNNCFKISGRTLTGNVAIDNDIYVNDMAFSSSSMSFIAGEWIQIHETATSKSYHDGVEYQIEGNADVGQITQVISSGNNPAIKDEAAKDYSISSQYGLRVRKIDPITNIGIENLTVRRIDSQSSSNSLGTNIRFEYAVNCWVKGVHSEYTSLHHITIDRCSHIEVSGCVIHDADSYQEGSWGYGIILSSSSTNCLIENNIFSHLRHSMAAVRGANSNVFAYDYSRDPYATWHGIPYSDSDLTLHGNFPFANLLEHNYIVEIEADHEHEWNGPLNAFVRNKVESEINLSYAPQTAALGCEVEHNKFDIGDGMTFSVEEYGFGYGAWKSHQDMEGLDRSQFVLNDVSYYYSSTPDFVLDASFQFPSIGPKASGYDNPHNYNHNIPARQRYLDNNDNLLYPKKDMIYLPDPMPFPSGITQEFQNDNIDVVISLDQDDLQMTLYGLDQWGLADQTYIFDMYKLETQAFFCPIFSESPLAIWLNPMGIKPLDNFPISRYVENDPASAYDCTLRTYFYYIKQNTLGQQINKWVPFNPYSSSYEYFALGTPGTSTTSGYLSHDEAWCGTHALTGNVLVPDNTVLYIKDGATINLNGYYIQCQGSGQIIKQARVLFPHTMSA